MPLWLQPLSQCRTFATEVSYTFVTPGKRDRVTGGKRPLPWLLAKANPVLTADELNKLTLALTFHPAFFDVFPSRSQTSPWVHAVKGPLSETLRQERRVPIAPLSPATPQTCFDVPRTTHTPPLGPECWRNCWTWAQSTRLAVSCGVLAPKAQWGGPAEPMHRSCSRVIIAAEPERRGKPPSGNL